MTKDFTKDGEVTSVYEASQSYQEAGTPLVVLAGKEYGSGSSRDWAAKGTALLGVKAVIAESYERIHRSNLIGMGVIPLQFPEGKTADDLGLTGAEIISISGITELNDGTTPKTVTVKVEPAPAPTRRTARPASSRPPSASTPRARPTTTATAGSCSTSCATSSRADAPQLHACRTAAAPPLVGPAAVSPCRGPPPGP